MPAKKNSVRVLIKLPNQEAKVFSSLGPLVSGSVVDLPSEEAEQFMARGCALPSFDECENKIAPVCDVEYAATNENERGSSKARHFQRDRKLNTDNAVVREAEG